MKIFISGGAGFIGSHLTEFFLDASNENQVIVYDNFSSGGNNIPTVTLNNERLSIIEGDIKHMGDLVYAMRGTDLVIHLAANPDISKAVKHPDIDFWEGTFLTHNILEAIRINEVGKILYTSGSGVYGEVDGVSFSESHGPNFPISTYGASKLACEALISSYCHMFEIQGRAFRFANVVGARQTHGVGYDFIRRLKMNPNQLKILGDGTQCKSYIHISDIISAVNLVNERMDNKPFDLFNVATEDYLTVTEIANVACNVLGINSLDVKFDYTGGDRGWKGDVPRVLFDTTKIKLLGWVPKLNSKEAITQSLEEMRHEFSS